MTEFTPDTSRHRDATSRIVQNNSRILFAIIQLNFETARYRENCLVTRPMGVTTAGLAVWNVCNPKNTLHREGNVYITLQVRQTTPIVHILRKLNPFYPPGEFFLFHCFFNYFGAKIHFFSRFSCIIPKKPLPLHRKTEEESSFRLKID